MPRDLVTGCKKRQHPDGLHLSSSLPKRLLSISEAQISSSVEDASISPGTTMNTTHGSLCNSASSALINSGYSTSIHSPHSSMSLDAGSSKLEGPSFVLSRLPSDAASSKLEAVDQMRSCTPSNVASYALGTLNRTSDTFHQGTGRGIWAYRSDSTKHKGPDCDGEMSEVTFERHAQTLSSDQETDRVSGFEKATHVISRRDGSSLKSKDELWHKAAHGYGDFVSRGKQWESSSKLVGARQKREYRFSSVACESASSCATNDSVRPMQAFPQMNWSAGKESSTALSLTHIRAEVLVEPRSQERRPVAEGVWNPPTHKAVNEELSPSYVLSSGRMSLEEEAKLGRRAPTIDHDFEEYFSSLML